MEIDLSHTGDNTAINVVKSDRRYDQDLNKAYYMGSNPKGYLLIIKHSSLSSFDSDSERDAQTVQDLFLKLGYNVIQKRVSSSKNFMKVVEEFRKLLHNCTKVDSVFIYVLTYQKYVIYVPDLIEIKGKKIPIATVLNTFGNDVYFNDKPKVVFSQSTGIPKSTTEEFHALCYNSFPTIPEDCLIVSYFQRGQYGFNVSLRNICDMISKNAHNTDLKTMMFEVKTNSGPLNINTGVFGNFRVNTSLFKTLYFNPGIYHQPLLWNEGCEDPEDALRPFEIIVRKSKQRLDKDKSKTYKMGSRPKGYALVISNEKFTDDKTHKERIGGDKDRDNLNKLLTGLGYEVTVKHNLTKNEMEFAIISFRNDPKHKNVDSTIVFILTHGVLDGTNVLQLITSDNLHVDSEWIIEQFYGRYSPYLIGKPKLFFFQCCRGTDIGKIVKVVSNVRVDSVIKVESNVRADSVIKEIILNKTDILIVHACAPGSVVFRSPIYGSWMVHVMCKVFAENAHDTEVIDMLKETSCRVKRFVDPAMGTLEICYAGQGFDKKLYFNPGLYDN